MDFTNKIECIVCQLGQDWSVYRTSVQENALAAAFGTEEFNDKITMFLELGLHDEEYMSIEEWTEAIERSGMSEWAKTLTLMTSKERKEHYKQYYKHSGLSFAGLLCADQSRKQYDLIKYMKNPKHYHVQVRAVVTSDTHALIILKNFPEQLRMLQNHCDDEIFDDLVCEDVSAYHITCKWNYAAGSRCKAIRALDSLGLFSWKEVTIGFIPYKLLGDTLLVVSGSILTDLAVLSEAGVGPHGCWHVSA